MTGTAITDKERIDEILRGNTNAFEGLMKKYEGQVARTVARFLGQTQTAEDVGQEVFIKLFRSLNKFKGEAALGTYITRIAINLSLNELKKQKRKQVFRRFSNQEDSPELQLPDDHLTEEQKANRDWVQQALQMLDEDFRSVIILRMIEGYSTKETAKMLKIPEGTVLSRLSRAQKKLHEALQLLNQTKKGSHEA